MQQQEEQLINSDGGEVPPGSAIVHNMPVIPIGSRTYDLYKYKHSKGLGITLVIIGILCIIFNVVSIGLSTTDYSYSAIAYIGHGIWCGVLFIITGCFGIGAGVQKTKCLIVSFMVLCIISAVTTIPLLAMGILGACVDAGDCYHDSNYHQPTYGYGDSYPYYYPPCEKMIGYTVVVAMEASMAILAFIAGAVAIWGSVLICCSGVCCRCCTRSTSIVAQQTDYIPNSGQFVYLSQSQAEQNFYVQQQSMSPYHQGMMPPPYVANVYEQHPGWIMPPPTESNDPLIDQTPPQCPAVLQVTSAQGQPTDQGKF